MALLHLIKSGLDFLGAVSHKDYLELFFPPARNTIVVSDYASMDFPLHNNMQRLPKIFIVLLRILFSLTHQVF